MKEDSPEEKLEKARLHYDASSNTVLCEVCNTRVGLGRGKTGNYHKTHKNTPTCLAQKEKGEREAKRLEALANKPAVKPNRSLFEFVKTLPKKIASASSTKHSLVPSTSKAILSGPSIEISDTEDDAGLSVVTKVNRTAPAHPAPAQTTKDVRLVQELRKVIARLPETIAEGTEADVLARYGNDPESSFDCYRGIEGEAIWEAGLNVALKEGLGWGDGKTDWDVVIRRGAWGVDGLVRLVEYFVDKRGVPESLFKGKLTLLMEEMEKRNKWRCPPSSRRLLDSLNHTPPLANHHFDTLSYVEQDTDA
ncbi:hypothetical protein NMY22_g14768 [Coprinellus aureogranulatus]|nr:hypothetical protein NMY22_g14768 [Coprinellus aureogranulatus]